LANLPKGSARVELEKPMRLIVKQANGVVNELRFSKGPIYIGRQIGSQVFLPDRSVSRQHAVIYMTQDGRWMAEDLDSANKTYLNEQAIHKSEVKDSDLLRIADFTIQLHFDDEDEDKDKQEQPIDLGDTLKAAAHEPETIIRKISTDDAPVIRMPAKRANDFCRAVITVCQAKSHDKILPVLLDLLLKQFSAFRVWGGLRTEATGPMVFHAGKKRNGATVKLDELELREKITQAAENKTYILVPHMPSQKGPDRVRSAIISPVMAEDLCHGVLYVDNSVEHEHYSLTDLDYLMFLAMHTATLLKNI